MKIKEKLTIHLDIEDLKIIIKDYLDNKGYNLDGDVDFIVKKKEITYDRMNHSTEHVFEGVKVLGKRKEAKD